MLKSKVFVFFFIVLSSNLNAQNAIIDTASLLNYLKGKDPLVAKIITDSTYQLQLVYSQINPTDATINTIESTTGAYFFPASTVKLPIALLTLEKMERLGIGPDDFIKINADNACGNSKYIKLSKEYKLSFRTLLEEMIVVSDNHYYNILYHFITPKEINERLRELGYQNVHIYKAFTGCEPEEQLHANSLTVYHTNGESIYQQEESFYPMDSMMVNYAYSIDNLLGNQHENSDGIIVSGPFDFNFNLEIPLIALHEMLLRIIYPKSFDVSKRWNLSNSNRAFILNTLQRVPNSIHKSKYKNANRYPDNIYRYTVWENQPKDIVTTSKIGLSYGFTTEVAHIIDVENNIQFTLSISIYTNANDIVNDGNYEYETVARVFIAKIAELLYQNELDLRK